MRALASPLAKGLFSAATPMSGSCIAMKQETAEAAGRKLAEALHCGGPGVEALRRR